MFTRREQRKIMEQLRVVFAKRLVAFMETVFTKLVLSCYLFIFIFISLFLFFIFFSFFIYFNFFFTSSSTPADALFRVKLH